MSLRRMALIGAAIVGMNYFTIAHAEEIYMGIEAFSVNESTKEATTEERLLNYFDSSQINEDNKDFYNSLEKIAETAPESAAKIAVKIWPEAAIELYEKGSYKGLDSMVGTEITTKIINVFRKQPEDYFKKSVKLEEKKGNYPEAIDLCKKIEELYTKASESCDENDIHSEFYKKKAEKFLKKAKKLEIKWAKKSLKKLMTSKKMEEKNGRDANE